MARNSVKSNRRPYKSAQPAKASRYNQKTLLHDRQYGFYWYAWVWNTLRPVLILAISLVVVLGIITSGWNYVNNQFFAAVDVTDTQVREFEVTKGRTTSGISEDLYNQGFIKNKSIFKYIVQFRELTSNIQYGTYPISSNMDVNQIIDILAQGSSTFDRTITIIPGWTVRDIASYLAKQGAVDKEETILDMCKDASKFTKLSYPMDEALEDGIMGNRLYQLEGYLAPDTYRVYTNAQPEDIIQTLLKQSDNVFDQVFNTEPTFDVLLDNQGNKLDSEGNIITEDPELFKTTLTKNDTIILASIIEKEAGRQKDYRKVSAVFHNRMLNNMPLESDATISYALGIKRLILTSEELHTESPYNTYLNKGLPAGPICNPSKAALTAALYPDIDYVYAGYMYFCATDPQAGELEFSKTKEEHQAAVDKYRPLWEQYDETHR